MLCVLYKLVIILWCLDDDDELLLFLQVFINESIQV